MQPGSPSAPARNGRGRLLIAAAVSLILLALSLRGSNLRQSFEILGAANLIWWILAAAALVLVLFIKAVRWHYLFRRLRPIPIRRLWPVVVIGYLSNQILPSNTGEFVRSYILGRRESVEPGVAMATVVVEKITDIVALLIFLLGVVLLAPVPGWVKYVGWAAGLFLAVILAGLFGLVRWEAQFDAVVKRLTSYLPARIQGPVAGALNGFVLGLRMGPQGWMLAGVILLAVNQWAVQSISFALIGLAVGLNASPTAYILLSALIGLGSSIPALLGNLGTLEFLSLNGLAVFGVAGEPGLAFVLLLRATRLVPIAVGYFYFQREGLTSMWRQAERGETASTNILTH